MLPEGSRVQTLPPVKWLTFKIKLSGLNANSLPAAQAQLVQIGLAAAPPSIQLPMPVLLEQSVGEVSMAAQ